MRGSRRLPTRMPWPAWRPNTAWLRWKAASGCSCTSYADEPASAGAIAVELEAEILRTATAMREALQIEMV